MEEKENAEENVRFVKSIKDCRSNPSFNPVELSGLLVYTLGVVVVSNIYL